MKILSTALAIVLVAGPTLAREFSAGGLTIGQPKAYETAPSAMAGGGYFTITNAGEEADRLVDIRADFPRVALHTTEEQDGIARMRPVDAIEIEPGETVALEPGGLHVMFMGLGGDPFEVGEEIPATLVFERAGEIEITFAVEPRDGGAGVSGHHDEPTN